MAILPGSLDYTDKDFDAIRARLISLTTSVFPQWTDHNILTFANVLLELFAFVGDVSSFYQDNQGNEAFIPTATQRASIIKLAKGFGYELDGAGAATVDVKFTLSSGVTPGSVTLSAGTLCRTQVITDPVQFQILSDAVIPAAGDPPEIVAEVENSETNPEQFTSDGAQDQAFRLTYTPYLDGSLDGNIDTIQGTWAEVDDFLESEPLDLHFTVEVDQNDKATVRFGDGVQGAIPQGDIDTTYKTGGGLEGNVEPDSIKVVEGSFTDSLGNPVTVVCTNEVKAGGGTPRESIETARQQIPASIRAPRTTVAREDYEIHALLVTGVARALMLTADEDLVIGENSGFLYVVPRGGGEATETLRDQVLEAVTITYPNTITFRTQAVSASYLAINVHAVLYLRQGYDEAFVKSLVEANLEAYFALFTDEDTEDEAPNPLVDFGYNYKDVDGNPAGEIPWGDIYNVVRDTTGIRKIGDQASDFTLNGTDNDVPLEIRDFPILGTVELINGDTGLPM